jgi:hypothetical protein
VTTTGSNTAQVERPEALGKLKPVIVLPENDRTTGYVAHVRLGVKKVGVADLLAVRAYLAETVKQERGVTVTLDATEDHGYHLSVRYPSYGATEAALAELNELIQPSFSARGTAVGDMRRKDEKHTGTLVTITISTGKPKTTDIEAIKAVSGVLLAHWEGKGYNKLAFSLEDPVNGVDSTVEAVVDLLGIYVPQPVTVRDPNPNAALFPENAYEPVAVSTT